MSKFSLNVHLRKDCPDTVGSTKKSKTENFATYLQT